MRSPGNVSSRLVLSMAALLIGMLGCWPSITRADVPGRLGGGNLHGSRDMTDATARLLALKKLGVGMCRMPVGAADYGGGPGDTPHPERLDDLMRLAQRQGITPILLFEYYTRWNGELGGYDRWHAVGSAFAERFGPGSRWWKEQGVDQFGVTFYSAINEPMWPSNNPTPIPPERYAKAIEGLADGVHSVNATLHVNPGGWIEGYLFSNKNPYVKAVAPLFNNGKLHAVGIHRYWDVDYIPMKDTYRFSLQNQFDEVKRNAGITADVRFYTDEMNFKKRVVTEEEAAQGFLTGLWDALGVVGDDGKPACRFVMPWNIFHLTEKDEDYGLCTQLDPWTPTARGRVLAMVARLTQGMEIVAADPKKSGLFVLEGDGKKLWVWQNRKAWTDRPGTTLTLDGIPSGAERLEVFGWDGRRRTIELAGQSSLIVENLEQGETLMLLVKGEKSE